LKVAGYPINLVENYTELPADEYGYDDRAFSDQGLRLVMGITPAIADQLAVVSLEPAVVEMCKNDSTKRFPHLLATHQWQQKGRLALPLLDKEDRANGLAWMGEQAPGEDEPQIPGAFTTFALRIYERAAGKGLATPTTAAILAINETLFGTNYGAWLEAWGDNFKALKPYKNNGFNEVARIKGVRHGKELERVYMILGNYAAPEDVTYPKDAVPVPLAV
jgi:hypothetical protein